MFDIRDPMLGCHQRKSPNSQWERPDHGVSATRCCILLQLQTWRRETVFSGRTWPVFFFSFLCFSMQTTTQARSRNHLWGVTLQLPPWNRYRRMRGLSLVGLDSIIVRGHLKRRCYFCFNVTFFLPLPSHSPDISIVSSAITSSPLIM